MLRPGMTDALLTLHAWTGTSGVAGPQSFARPIVTGGHGMSPAERSMKSLTVESRRLVAFSGKADSRALV